MSSVEIVEQSVEHVRHRVGDPGSVVILRVERLRLRVDGELVTSLVQVWGHADSGKVVRVMSWTRS